MLYQFWSAITILTLALKPVVYHNTLNFSWSTHSHEHVPAVSLMNPCTLH